MSEWEKWGGGERPAAAGTTVEVRLRSGVRPRARSVAEFDWLHKEDDLMQDIVAYRIIQEEL